jgi:hypothetical protein
LVNARANYTFCYFGKKRRFPPGGLARGWGIFNGHHSFVSLFIRTTHSLFIRRMERGIFFIKPKHLHTVTGACNLSGGKGKKKIFHGNNKSKKFAEKIFLRIMPAIN